MDDDNLLSTSTEMRYYVLVSEYRCFEWGPALLGHEHDISCVMNVLENTDRLLPQIVNCRLVVECGV